MLPFAASIFSEQQTLLTFTAQAALPGWAVWTAPFSPGARKYSLNPSTKPSPQPTPNTQPGFAGSIPDPEWGEALVWYSLPLSDAERHLLLQAFQTLESWQRPKRILEGELPLTASGKWRRKLRGLGRLRRASGTRLG